MLEKLLPLHIPAEKQQEQTLLLLEYFLKTDNITCENYKFGGRKLSLELTSISTAQNGFFFFQAVLQ